jgi:hypothetical protein
VRFRFSIDETSGSEMRRMINKSVKGEQLTFVKVM